MQLDKFVDGFASMFKKSDLNDLLTNLKKTLITDTIPPYQSAVQTIGSLKFTAPRTKAFQEAFDTHRSTRGIHGNYVKVIYTTLETIRDNLPLVEALVEENFNENITKESLTLLRANLLQYIEACSFYTRYARLVLLMTWEEETAQVNPDARLGSSFTPASEKFLLDNEKAFSILTEQLGIKRERTEELMRDVPDANVSVDNYDILQRNVGKNRTDPFSQGLISHWLDPFWTFGRWWAEREAIAYKTAEVEREDLQLRLMFYKQTTRDSLGDVNLQKKIQVTEERIQKLTFQMSKMEDK